MENRDTFYVGIITVLFNILLYSGSGSGKNIQELLINYKNHSNLQDRGDSYGDFVNNFYAEELMRLEQFTGACNSEEYIT